jgi:5-methylcytosine-specific restriction enzyme subunit McrC
MLRHLRLTETRTSPAVALTATERDSLRHHLAVQAIPTWGLEGHYDLTPSSTVGTAVIGDLQVTITPKIGVQRLMFLLSYCLDPDQWWQYPAAAGDDIDVFEAVVPAFTTLTRQALRRGLLQGYEQRAEELSTVRGRVDVTTQVHRRFGQMLPLAVTYDEFSEDILANRLLKAAHHALARLPLRNPTSRWELRQVATPLEPVPLTHIPTAPVPTVSYTRLNQRYRPAVELARLILASRSPELGPADHTTIAFRVDMNQVFEDFVVIALREQLGLDAVTFPQGCSDQSLHLDEAGRVRLRPDLSWWHRGQCRFVGDVKYKRVNIKGVLHPDLYQVLSYAAATALPTALLIYAAGEDQPWTHTVRHLGIRLHVRTLQLSGAPSEILSEISDLAELVRTLEMEGRM